MGARPLRDLAVEAIKKLPENSSVDQIMYEVSLVANVLEGLEDVEAGRVISTDELKKRIKTWGSK
jgi:predicted transcriptional regulator